MKTEDYRRLRGIILSFYYFNLLPDAPCVFFHFNTHDIFALASYNFGLFTIFYNIYHEPLDKYFLTVTSRSTMIVDYKL